MEKKFYEIKVAGNNLLATPCEPIDIYDDADSPNHKVIFGEYDTYYAFEVDLEKMEGRFLFNTGENDQEEAEKVILERII